MAENGLFLASSFVLFEKGDEILLLLRKNTGYMDGFYGLPAGHIDKGETPIETAIREAKEEVDIDLIAADLSLIDIVQADAVYEKNVDYFNFFFKASKWQGEPKNMEPNKCAELVWANVNNLPDNLLEHVRLILQNRKNSPTILATEQVRNRNTNS